VVCVSVFFLLFVCVFFFFSSRRRHTRCLSDWSSDVCSSDLIMNARRYERFAALRITVTWIAGCLVASALMSADSIAAPPAPLDRSEERRVGKEGRAREETDQ